MDRTKRPIDLKYHTVYAVITLGLMLVVGLFTTPLDLLFFRTNIQFPPIGMITVAGLSAMYMSGYFRNPHLSFGVFIPEIFIMIVAYTACHSAFRLLWGQTGVQVISGSVVIIATGLVTKCLVYGYYTYRSRHASHYDMVE